MVINIDYYNLENTNYGVFNLKLYINILLFTLKFRNHCRQRVERLEVTDVVDDCFGILFPKGVHALSHRLMEAVTICMRPNQPEF